MGRKGIIKRENQGEQQEAEEGKQINKLRTRKQGHKEKKEQESKEQNKKK